MYIIISISIIISSFSFLVLFLKITRVSNCWVHNWSQIFGCGVELLRQRCPSLVWYESSTSVIFMPRNQAINQIQKCQYTMQLDQNFRPAIDHRILFINSLEHAAIGHLLVYRSRCLFDFYRTINKERLQGRYYTILEVAITIHSGYLIGLKTIHLMFGWLRSLSLNAKQWLQLFNVRERWLHNCGY